MGRLSQQTSIKLIGRPTGPPAVERTLLPPQASLLAANHTCQCVQWVSVASVFGTVCHLFCAAGPVLVCPWSACPSGTGTCCGVTGCSLSRGSGWQPPTAFHLHGHGHNTGHGHTYNTNPSANNQQCDQQPNNHSSCQPPAMYCCTLLAVSLHQQSVDACTPRGKHVLSPL